VPPGEVQMERTWTGHIRSGAEEDHQRFVAWLRSAEGQRLLARTLLTDYRLYRDGERVTVRFSADEPPAIIRFLRHPRFWPEFWEFESADRASAVGASADELIAWRK
jgi:hypothetical protein